MIPYGKQFIDDDDIAAVVAVLKSDFLTQGPTIPRFEQSMAAFVGAKHAVAVTNATAALHIGALALGLKPEDRLWTSPNTFVASANCGLYCGATVDFVDIDPRTYNISVEALSEKLRHAEKNGTLPKILVPVDFAGQSCEMAEIYALAQRYGVRVMEDASHAVGGEYKGTRIGCCKHADITVFSFHPVKIMTTGEGGMLLTNDDGLHQALLRLRSHGITRDPALMANASQAPWGYAQMDLGFNYRLTDLQAALGESQIRKLPTFVARRRELAARYDEQLAALPLVLPWQHPDTRSSWHLYAIRTAAERRLTVYQGLRSAGILAQIHYIPVHTQPFYQRLGFKPGDFPVAKACYDGTLSLPLFYSMTAEEQARVVQVLGACLKT